MFDLSADVDDANVIFERTSKKRKRGEGANDEKKKKTKKTDDKKSAGSGKKDKMVRLKLSTMYLPLLTSLNVFDVFLCVGQQG
jgi:hypothetical protein